MGRVKTGNARVTVGLRVSKASLEVLDAFAKRYGQTRPDLMREAIQMWISQQIELRGNPLDPQEEVK